METPVEIRIELTRFYDEKGKLKITAYQMREYYEDRGWVNFGDQGYIAELEEDIVQMARELEEEYEESDTIVRLVEQERDLLGWYFCQGGAVGTCGDDAFNELVFDFFHEEKHRRIDRLKLSVGEAHIANFCQDDDVLLYSTIDDCEKAYREYVELEEENNQGE